VQGLTLLRHGHGTAGGARELKRSRMTSLADKQAFGGKAKSSPAGFFSTEKENWCLGSACPRWERESPPGHRWLR
jgi:hypothetical protein